MPWSESSFSPSKLSQRAPSPPWLYHTTLTGYKDGGSDLILRSFLRDILLCSPTGPALEHWDCSFISTLVSSLDPWNASQSCFPTFSITIRWFVEATGKGGSQCMKIVVWNPFICRGRNGSREKFRDSPKVVQLLSILTSGWGYCLAIPPPTTVNSKLISFFHFI